MQGERSLFAFVVVVLTKASEESEQTGKKSGKHGTGGRQKQVGCENSKQLLQDC